MKCLVLERSRMAWVLLYVIPSHFLIVDKCMPSVGSLGRCCVKLLFNSWYFSALDTHSHVTEVWYVDGCSETADFQESKFYMRRP